MSIELKFPDGEHQDHIRAYQQEKQFKQVLSDLCFCDYDLSDGFVFTLYPTFNNQSHTWKCSYGNQCEANMIYQKDQASGQYVLKDINPIHTHKASYFENFRQQKLKQKLGQPKRFTFPQDLESFQIMEDQDIIRSTLENQWIQTQPSFSFGFISRKSHEQGFQNAQIIYQCKYKDENFLGHKCPWKMIFKKDSLLSKWILGSHNVVHSHYIIMDKKNIFGKERAKQSCPYKNTSIIQLTGNTSFPKHKYGQRFIDGYNKVFQEPQKPLYQVLKMGLKSVRKYHMEIRYKNRNELLSNQNFVDIQEDILVISSKMMKFMCKSYGKVVYMKKQRFYQNQEKVDQKTNKKEDVYSIVTFFGFNHGYSVVVFGFAVIRNFTTEKGVRILDKFKNNYLHTLEALIVGDTDIQMKKVIEQYPSAKKTFHICIRSVPKNQDLQNFINDASRGYLQVQVQKYIMVANEELHEDIFEDQTTKYWFTSYHDCFLGLDFSLDGPKQLDPENVKEVAGESNITTFEFQMQNLIRQANDNNSQWFMKAKQKNRFQILFMGRQDLKKCRLMMGKIPLAKLIQQVLLIPTVTILATDTKTFYMIGDQSYPYIVSKKNEKWQCQCEHSVKTGIGCVHELKVYVIREQNIFEAINMFWIMDQAILNLEPNPQKANGPQTIKRKRRSGRKKLIA